MYDTKPTNLMGLNLKKIKCHHQLMIAETNVTTVVDSNSHPILNHHMHLLDTLT